MKLSGLLFAFDGTLDSDGVEPFERFSRLYAQNGLAIPAASLKDAVEKAEWDPDPTGEERPSQRDKILNQVRHQFRRLGLAQSPLEETIATAYYRRCERILHRNRNILEKLQWLGLSLGVISKNKRLRELCDEFGLTPFIKTVLIETNSENSSRSTFFTTAAQELTLPPDRVGLVASAIAWNILPAKSAGMKTFWLAGDRPQIETRAPEIDHILLSLEDLPRLLKASPADV